MLPNYNFYIPSPNNSSTYCTCFFKFNVINVGIGQSSAKKLINCLRIELFRRRRLCYASSLPSLVRAVDSSARQGIRFPISKRKWSLIPDRFPCKAAQGRRPSPTVKNVESSAYKVTGNFNRRRVFRLHLEISRWKASLEMK